MWDISLSLTNFSSYFPQFPGISSWHKRQGPDKGRICSGEGRVDLPVNHNSRPLSWRWPITPQRPTKGTAPFGMWRQLSNQRDEHEIACWYKAWHLSRQDPAVVFHELTQRSRPLQYRSALLVPMFPQTAITCRGSLLVYAPLMGIYLIRIEVLLLRSLSPDYSA